MSNPVIPNSGERQGGELTSDLPVLGGWSWPYVAISGKRDGPRVTIVAGIHGCEYVSIRAAVRLARELDPSELIGQAVIVPIVSLPMFWERTPFVNPFDGKNPNRVFPGKATGTFAEAMAYFIFESCIKPSDAFIDLHGGDMVEELAPFAGYAANAEPRVAARSKAMAEAFGLDFLIPHRRELSSAPGLTHLSAAQQGIAAVLAEAGGIGQLTQPEVDLLVEGTRRALQAAGNLPGEPNPPITSHTVERSQMLRAPAEGFWISEVRAGDEVRAGQPVGRILSLLGETIATVEAPFDGAVIYRTTSAAMKHDGILMQIAW